MNDLDALGCADGEMAPDGPHPIGDEDYANHDAFTISTSWVSGPRMCADGESADARRAGSTWGACPVNPQGGLPRTRNRRENTMRGGRQLVTSRDRARARRAGGRGER